MTAKEWIERGFKLNVEIEQLKEARDRAEKMNDVCKKSLPSYGEYSRMLFKRIDTLLNICREITEAVSLVDDAALRTLLTARYINFKTWEQVAEDMELDERWIYRLRKKAMAELEKVLIKRDE